MIVLLFVGLFVGLLVVGYMVGKYVLIGLICMFVWDYGWYGVWVNVICFGWV